jgi:hypothetical protein
VKKSCSSVDNKLFFGSTELALFTSLVDNSLVIRLEGPFRVLGSLLILILLGAFLPFSSLGGGSGEQMQTPLGAHQKRILFANKG